MAKQSGGSSRGEAQSYADAIYSDWQRMDKMDRVLAQNDERGVAIWAVRFKCPTLDNGSWLAVVTGNVDGVESVAFHDGATFRETLVGLVNRMENGGLKWKENKPYNER